MMQAAAQKYIDSSISKTVNIPAETAFDNFAALYLQAYETGCKGCTTYRPNAVTGSVLSVADPAAQQLAAPEPDAGVVYMTQPLDRPDSLIGKTYKLRWPESDHAILSR